MNVEQKLDIARELLLASLDIIRNRVYLERSSDDWCFGNPAELSEKEFEQHFPAHALIEKIHNFLKEG